MSLLDIIPGESRPAVQSPTFGDAVISYAKAKHGDLTPRQVAKLVMVTPATLRRWRNGGTPPRNGLRWTAKCLGLPDTTFLHFRAAHPSAA